jgi:hypothetical protein
MLCVLRRPSPAEVLLAESNIKALADVLQVSCCWCFLGRWLFCSWLWTAAVRALAAAATAARAAGCVDIGLLMACCVCCCGGRVL